jgi:hypothetical protein
MGKAKPKRISKRPPPESTDPGDPRWWSLVLMARRLMERLGPDGEVALGVYRAGLLRGQQYCMVQLTPRGKPPEPWRLMEPEEWVRREMHWRPATAGGWHPAGRFRTGGYQDPPQPDEVWITSKETGQLDYDMRLLLAWGPYIEPLLLPTDDDPAAPSPAASPPNKPDTMHDCAKVALRAIATDARDLGLLMPDTPDGFVYAVEKKCKAWGWTLMSRDTILRAANELSYRTRQPRPPRKPK